MKEWIEIHWTAGSIDEARRICRFLVQEKLVACAQITPWVESIYLWNNQLETAQESKVTLKTRLCHFEEICQVIKKNCTYEVPQLLYTHFDGGAEPYMSWLDESTASTARSGG